MMMMMGMMMIMMMMMTTTTTTTMMMMMMMMICAGTWGQRRAVHDNRRDGDGSYASGSIRAKDRVLSAAASYVDPSDEEDDEGGDAYDLDDDDFEIYDDPDDAQSDSDIDTSRGGRGRGIYYLRKSSLLGHSRNVTLLVSSVPWQCFLLPEP